jgi:hypothetical protein
MNSSNNRYEQIKAEMMSKVMGNQNISLGTAIDITARTSSRSRDQLNNKTIEEYNNTSRKDSADVTEVKNPVIEKPRVITEPRELRYRGIAVQHARPKTDSAKPGIKLAITLQSLDQMDTGERLLVTAELKRYDRLREVKPKIEDSANFAVVLEDMKKSIYVDKDRDVCMGRIHARGKRSQWYNDCLVIATLKNNVIHQVILHLMGESYTICMNQELTYSQLPLYLSAGTYGEIVNINSGSADLRLAKATPFAK